MAITRREFAMATTDHVIVDRDGKVRKIQGSRRLHSGVPMLLVQFEEYFSDWVIYGDGYMIYEETGMPAEDLNHPDARIELAAKPEVPVQKHWPRRAEFVNIILGMSVGYGHLDMELDRVIFDGIAGERFHRAILGARKVERMTCDCIHVALQLGVPVQGLESEIIDGKFGPKWDEVVALAKQAEPAKV